MAPVINTRAPQTATGAATSKVDHALLKFNQATIIVLLLLAYLFNWAWLVAVVAAVMVVGSIWPRAGLFKIVAQKVVQPSGLLKADVREDIPQPHLFAQMVGGLMLVAATAALFLGAQVLGWVLVAIVVSLAAVNLFLGFCAGCFMYYQLARRGLRPNLPTWQPLTAR
jgi:prepilin signal peptidase PulO-like enzyme (type II secretory pathway)